MARLSLEAPRRLSKSDNRNAFDCGDAELNAWLRNYSWQNQRANNAVTYVSVSDSQVFGYYALAAAAVRKELVPEEFGKRRPAQIPCILLARLAVDLRLQGHGVGAALLRDAFNRVANASEELGVAAMLVHCKNNEAKAFYCANADFIETASEPLTLILPVKAILGRL